MHSLWRAKRYKVYLGERLFWHYLLQLSFVYKTVSQISFTFLLAKENTWKRIFNSNSELSQNCTEKQIMSSKTTINWLFNNICYLFIACFEWKIDVFQQTVVRVYYIPKSFRNSDELITLITMNSQAEIFLQHTNLSLRLLNHNESIRCIEKSLFLL